MPVTETSSSRVRFIRLSLCLTPVAVRAEHPVARPGHVLGPAQLPLLQPLRVPHRPHGSRHRGVARGDLLQPADLHSLLLRRDLAAAEGHGIHAGFYSRAERLPDLRHHPAGGRPRPPDQNRLVLPGADPGRHAGCDQPRRNRDELRRQHPEPAGARGGLADRALPGAPLRIGPLRLAGRCGGRNSGRLHARPQAAFRHLLRGAVRGLFRPAPRRSGGGSSWPSFSAWACWPARP